MKAVKSPWRVDFFLEKYERSRWHKQFFDHKIFDICPHLFNSSEPWFHITAHFKQKHCPFEAGHIEHFGSSPHSEEEVAYLPSDVTFSMAGKYRGNFVSYFTDENGSISIECVRIAGEVIEG